MSAVIALGALSALAALIGFILGKSFSWPAIAAFSIGLAVLSAVMLQRQGFGARSGIAFGVAFLSLSQIAYLGGSCARHRVLIEKEADKEPRDRRDNGIAGNQPRQQKRPSWFA
jgi:hypothetical protein